MSDDPDGDDPGNYDDGPPRVDDDDADDGGADRVRTAGSYDDLGGLSQTSIGDLSQRSSGFAASREDELNRYIEASNLQKSSDQTGSELRQAVAGAGAGAVGPTAANSVAERRRRQVLRREGGAELSAVLRGQGAFRDVVDAESSAYYSEHPDEKLRLAIMSMKSDASHDAVGARWHRQTIGVALAQLEALLGDVYVLQPTLFERLLHLFPDNDSVAYTWWSRARTGDLHMWCSQTSKVISAAAKGERCVAVAAAASVVSAVTPKDARVAWIASVLVQLFLDMTSHGMTICWHALRMTIGQCHRGTDAAKREVYEVLDACVFAVLGNSATPPQKTVVRVVDEAMSSRRDVQFHALPMLPSGQNGVQDHASALMAAIASRRADKHVAELAQLRKGAVLTLGSRIEGVATCPRDSAKENDDVAATVPVFTRDVPLEIQRYSHARARKHAAIANRLKVLIVKAKAVRAEFLSHHLRLRLVRAAEEAAAAAAAAPPPTAAAAAAGAGAASSSSIAAARLVEASAAARAARVRERVH